MTEKLADTVNGVMRRRKSEKDKQYNIQQKKDKGTNGIFYLFLKGGIGWNEPDKQ